ncbi:MAG TPA: type 1 glutamine amidotransferase [Thiobacillaceae bacterium]|nr:type 1 glutamine amidotransferase [Thiobacillaceae bacterium]HNU64330.1 type 1 glutamine amidotransferase [Thiobacillaceae bacterium]
MKPIAIFRHAPSEGPGYLATFLEERGLAWKLVAIDAGEGVPASPGAFAGLVFMGGPMSVNDDLPWIPPALSLIRLAVQHGIPVLGHCLGSQLMAKALDGRVTRNPVKEIGWGRVERADNAEARAWLPDLAAFEAFHWHGETFSLPPGAARILGSTHCTNQAFVLGPHLGMQCHVEMTGPMIREWCVLGADEIAAASSPAVQSPERMQSLNAANLPGLHAAAEALYTRWTAGLQA